MTSLSFVEPTDINEAEQRILELTCAIREISVQLSDRNRLGDDGERLSNREYYEWHQRAITARAYKESELAFIRLWVKQQNRKMTELLARESYDGLDSDDPVSLLGGAYKLLKDLHNSGAQLTKEETALMDVIRDCLKGVL